MGKLIDADEFVEWLMSDAITDEQRKFAEQVKYAADRMKPVDAAKVVRCNACKYFTGNYCSLRLDACTYRDFCSFAELWEGAQDAGET